MTGKIVTYFLVFISLVACGNRPRTSSLGIEKRMPVMNIGEISLSTALLTELTRHIDYYHFQTKVFIRDGKEYVIFLDTSRNKFLLFGLQENTSIDSIKFKTKYGKLFFAGNSGNDFYFYFPQKNILEYHQLNNKTIDYVAEYPLPALNRNFTPDEFNIFGIINEKKPLVIIGYGVQGNKKYSYKDPDGCLLLLDPERSSPVRLGFYPSRYFDKEKYYSSPRFIVNRETGAIYYTFELNDSIYHLSAENRIMNKAELQRSNGFNEFDWKRERDLAYVRKYTILSEKNERVYFIANSKILVLKKLGKKSISEVPRYKYFVFDSLLNKIYCDTLKAGCYPQLATPYKNGFLILGDSLRRAYYYETN